MKLLKYYDEVQVYRCQGIKNGYYGADTVEWDPILPNHFREKAPPLGSAQLNQPIYH